MDGRNGGYPRLVDSAGWTISIIGILIALYIAYGLARDARARRR